MDPCVHHHHKGPPSSVASSHPAHAHSSLIPGADQHVAGNDMAYQNVASAPTAALVEMLSRIDALEAIPRLQVEEQSSETLVQESTPSSISQQLPSCSEVPIALSSSSLPLINSSVHVEASQLNSGVGGASIATLTPVTSDMPAVVSTITILPQSSSPEAEVKRSKVGRPRTKPQKEKTEWHQHLGGVRHCRVPLTPDLREVLEVAYVSKIMSKNFRKEGQPEKERIARITGMDIEKVQEWFKNRRKKDKLLKERTQPKKRGRPSNSNSSPTATTAKKVQSLEDTIRQALISPSPQHSVVDIDTRSLLSQLPQQTVVNENSHTPSSSLSHTHDAAAATMATSSGPLNLHNSAMDTVAGHEIQVASSIELTI